jgi:hypothetical protein
LHGVARRGTIRLVEREGIARIKLLAAASFIGACVVAVAFLGAAA